MPVTKRVNIDIKLYQIAKCGYYPRSSELDPIIDVGEVFRKLDAWRRRVGGTTQTCTFDQSESLPVFCAYMTRASPTGDFVMTTWNAVPTGSNNTVAALTMDSTPDSPQFNIKTYPTGSFPGYPTYFWVLPDKGYVFAVKVEKGMTGAKGLAKYMKGFLESHHSEMCNYEEDEDGIRTLVGHGSENKFRPSFELRSWADLAAIAQIKENQEDISKIIKKEMTVNGASRSMFAKALSLFGVTLDTGESTTLGTREIRYELEYKPSSNDIDKMYANYVEEHQAGRGKNDVGFQIGGGETLWFSHSHIVQLRQYPNY